MFLDKLQLYEYLEVIRESYQVRITVEKTVVFLHEKKWHVQTYKKDLRAMNAGRIRANLGFVLVLIASTAVTGIPGRACVTGSTW